LITNKRKEIIIMLRMTHQREIILEELRKQRNHPTADELYNIVRKRLNRISLATVYRNLEQMSEAGLVKKLVFAGSQNRFDGDISEHYHIQCRQCGRVSDIHVSGIEISNEIILEDCEYEDVSSLIEFTGICPECKRQGE
jgi:Fur family ferric uptake transcriptional regulator